jgi:hypothetical protein
MPALPGEGPYRLAARGFAALACLLPALAFAQQPGPPIPLLPPLPPPPEAPAPPLSPAPPIASEPLPSPPSGWSGDVAPPEHALPPDFWHGTARALAELLLGHLPDTTVAALQSLERRLLLSPAAAPQGPDAPGMSLPALRAAALLRLGEVDAARAVLAAAPESKQDAFLRLAVAADAITGNLDRACAVVRRAIRGDQGAFWQRALISCQGLAGEVEEARLGIQLLNEEKQPPGRALLAAVETLAGRRGAAPAAITRLDDPTPLLLRLLVKAKLPLSRRLVESLSPELALTLALDEAAPPATQLAAAERAARFGALSPARLSALYTALAATAAPGDDPSLLRAQRFAAIAEASSAGERLARIVAFARDLIGPHGRGWALAARLVMPQLRDIDPDPALASLAGAAARLALAGGSDTLARQWDGLLSGAERSRVDFLLTLAAPDNAAEGGGESGASALRIALLAALGRPVPPREWLLLPAGAWSSAALPGAPIAPWLDLLAAASAQRVGETVLAGLLVAGSNGAVPRDPAALYAAINGLARVGLGADARRLAVEAALAAGL